MAHQRHAHAHKIFSAQRDILNYKEIVALCVCEGVFIGDNSSVREWACLKAEN